MRSKQSSSLLNGRYSGSQRSLSATTAFQKRSRFGLRRCSTAMQMKMARLVSQKNLVSTCLNSRLIRRRSSRLRGCSSGVRTRVAIAR